MALINFYLILVCSWLLQTGTGAPAPDCLLAAEKARLQTDAKLDDRLKIYDGASVRCRDFVTAAVKSQDLQSIPRVLKCWTGLLEDSLKDLEQSTVRKDKSKALRRFEINLRKEIGDMQELKLKASADQFDSFEAWLTRAEAIRKRFVDMLFQR